MKTVLGTVLLLSSLSAQAQLTLNAGESYTYTFTNLPVSSFCNACGGCPHGIVELWSAANLGLESGDQLRLEMFEGVPTGTPILSRTITSTSAPGDFHGLVCGSWQDRQGSFRLTMLSGSAVIQQIRIQSEEFSISPNGYRFYTVDLFPSARPALEILGLPPELIIRWPASAVNFVLEAAPTIPSTNWLVVTNAVQTDGSGMFFVQVDRELPSRFFRLRAP